jgi:serine/threonine-protein kinase HipA
MAMDCGINMSPCRLYEEGGRRHFLTKRFGRLENGRKLHMQSLGAMSHLDFNQAGAHSYEQAFLVMNQLGLPANQMSEMFTRMVFNVVARNQDDHVKNIAFLMDQNGQWSLSPAFDMTYSYQPQGPWTSSHQMTINGKRDHFTLDDFYACGKTAMLKKSQIKKIINEV